jgi:hypothetical protein
MASLRRINSTTLRSVRLVSVYCELDMRAAVGTVEQTPYCPIDPIPDSDIHIHEMTPCAVTFLGEFEPPATRTWDASGAFDAAAQRAAEPEPTATLMLLTMGGRRRSPGSASLIYQLPDVGDAGHHRVRSGPGSPQGKVRDVADRADRAVLTRHAAKPQGFTPACKSCGAVCDADNSPPAGDAYAASAGESVCVTGSSNFGRPPSYIVKKRHGECPTKPHDPPSWNVRRCHIPHTPMAIRVSVE